jgi:hypothetical protein
MITKLKYLLLLLLFIFPCKAPHVYSQSKTPDLKYRLLANHNNYVLSKNYYLLMLFQQLPGVKKMLEEDPVLQLIAKNKIDSLNRGLKSCDKDGFCYTGYIKFSEGEINQIADRLKILWRPGNAIDKLVTDHLIPSGNYVLFNSAPAPEMLAKAWIQDANGINFAIGVYAEGKKPNYPNIDSIGFNTRDPRNKDVFLPGYVNLLYNTISLVAIENRLSKRFYDIPLSAALQFIELNDRERAADYEPMIQGENKAASERIKIIKWNSYKYSLIMIPGAGPEQPDVSLSAEGMLRCRLAAIQYKKGMAPFILTSGGKVHPYKTKYCEAVEMKKYLIEKLNIPANAILIDPHARHTTTNMRNTVRLIYRYGLPFSKPAITCTTRGQSNMIERTLIDRCMKELNEVPYKNGIRLSETEMEFYPLIEALHINPMEPMDP